jgi:queuosine precursor transporter
MLGPSHRRYRTTRLIKTGGLTLTAPTAGPSRPALLSPVTRVAIAAVGAYVGAQVIADVTSLKIGSFTGRAVDMGTFIYPITFTLRDVVHKALGRRAARTLIVTAAVVNLFMAAYLQWAAKAPSDPSYALGPEFAAVLAPLWRITLASIAAEVVSELVDTEVYHWFVRRVTARHQWARVALSNAVSVPLDNVIFAVGAFGALPGLRDHALTLPWDVVWEIFVVNLTVKALVSACSLPLIYVTPDRDWSRDDDDA